MSFLKTTHEYLESLDKTHILIFHEKKENAETIEFDFIKSGLEKGHRCYYTTSEPDRVKKAMKEFGILVEKYVESDFLNVIQIPESFEEYEKMIEEKVTSLPKNETIRVVSTHFFDFKSERETESMQKIEQWVDDNFEKIPGNFICSFHVPTMKKDVASNFMKNLLDSHHAVIVLTNDDKVEKFNFP